MPIGINLPVPSPWDIKHNKNVLNNQIYQQGVDNDFRRMSYHDQQSWNWRLYNDSKNRIQNLVADAQKAGVSPLAALGSGGQAPLNLSMPVGQGGRAAGNYQRQSPIEAQISHNLVQKDNLDTEMKWLTYYSMIKDLQMKSWQMNRMLDEPTYDPLYVPLTDNYDEATKWVEQGMFPIVNPDANMEMNESVGSYYFFKPRPEGFINNLE